MRVPIDWLREHGLVPHDATGEQIDADLVRACARRLAVRRERNGGHAARVILRTVLVAGSGMKIGANHKMSCAVAVRLPVRTGKARVTTVRSLHSFAVRLRIWRGLCARGPLHASWARGADASRAQTDRGMGRVIGRDRSTSRHEPAFAARATATWSRKVLLTLGELICSVVAACSRQVDDDTKFLISDRSSGALPATTFVTD